MIPKTDHALHRDTRRKTNHAAGTKRSKTGKHGSRCGKKFHRMAAQQGCHFRWNLSMGNMDGTVNADCDKTEDEWRRNNEELLARRALLHALIAEQTDAYYACFPALA